MENWWHLEEMTDTSGKFFTIYLLDPDSSGSMDPDPDSYSETESRSGSRRAKMTHKSRKK
jgi:hypothetical protein